MLVVTFLLILAKTAASNVIYVTPNQTCAADCSGSSSDPSNDILLALQQACQTNGSIINLLSHPSLSHYILFNSTMYAAKAAEGSALASEYMCSNLTIKPLFCSDEIVQLHPSELSSTCIDGSQKLTVYMKTTDFTISVLQGISVNNIVFDAIEDIKHINSNSTELMDCLTNRGRCCREGDLYSSVYPGDIVRCALSGDYSSLSLTPNTSLFQLKDDTSGAAKLINSINFEGVTFQNFLSPHLQSLIGIQAESDFSVIIAGTVLNRVYFDRGVLYDYSKATTTNNLTSSSSIYFESSSLTNYNIWSLKLQDSTRSEGYLFNADSLFSRTITITNSTFSNAVSSLRDTCWPQTTTYYDFPMNNLLTSAPYPRSDLWSQYHKNRARNDYISSLIYIPQFYGAIFISTTSFINIIGTSGSVLRIDDVPSSGTWITVNNSVFDGNFAYDSFANLLVTKRSDPNFSSMLACPSMRPLQSKFINSYGCPGAYGNILYLCYWDGTPPSQSSLSDYSLPSNTSLYSTAWTTNNEDSATVQITGCNFTNNLLSVSNSLAIIGSSYTILDKNIFDSNGGTSAEIAEYSLQGSYFLDRYPNGITLPLDMIHFGQATAVYFNHLVRLISENNTYKENWGPWEGSLALGSSLTIKNWIATNQGLILSDDKFINHYGVIASMSSIINAKGIADGTYVSPIVTMSIDIDGSTAVDLAMPELNIQDTVGIQLNGVQFINNTANYDYTSYDYNTLELDYILNQVIPGNVRYQTGLIKLISVSEAIDSVDYGFKSDVATINKATFFYSGGLISQNKLISSGCLFTSVFFIDSVHILSNEIFLAGESFLQSPSILESYLMPTSIIDQGLLCIGAPDYVGSVSRLQLTANNLVVQNNQGIVINVFITTEGRTYLTNSIFTNNTCIALATVSIRDSGRLFAYNNIFTNNNNSAANMIVYAGGKLVSVSNVYLNNTGKYASLIYMESVIGVFEILAKAHYNTVNPDYKVFIQGGAPQAGLYLVSYSPFTILGSEYMSNYAYAGIATSYKGTVKMFDCQVAKHNITGSSVIGTFLAMTSLILSNVNLTDNIITTDTSMVNIQAALIVLITSKIQADNVIIMNGGSNAGAMLLFTDICSGVITNLQIYNFYRNDNGLVPLIYLSSSQMSISSLITSNTTGLFKLMGTRATMSNLNIRNITNKFSSQFLLYTFDSTISIDGLNYRGDGELNAIWPLLSGNRNSIKLINSILIDAGEGQTQVFSLKSSSLFFVHNTVFKYYKSYVNTTLFELQSISNIIIQNCVFQAVGTILNADSTSKGLYFTENTVLIDSHMPSAAITDSNATYITDNNLLRLSINELQTLPDSQISVSSSVKSSLLFSHNNLVSLYGTNGLLQINSQKYHYTANISKNTFINNSAMNGGAIYLESQDLSDDTSSSITYITDSVFILNQAISSEEDLGKGGAIYQTTPDQTIQDTIITNSHFINNEASRIGGAIFFNYKPPQISEDSKFKDNYAGRINHIGSYPTQLVYLSEESYSNLTYTPGEAVEKLEKDTVAHIWKNVASGVITEQEHSFMLLDMYNQIVYNDDASSLEIYPIGLTKAQRDAFSSDLEVKAENGIFTLEGFNFAYDVNTNLKVQFVSTVIANSSDLKLPNIVFSPSLEIEINFRGCITGEFIAFAGGMRVCQQCQPSFWQLKEDAEIYTCDACETSSTVCLGANKVGPKEGYWRMNETADMVLPCPREESCLGTEIEIEKKMEYGEQKVEYSIPYPAGQCAEHYEGNLCNECQEGWAKNNGETCADCSSSAVPYLSLFGMIAVKVALIIFGVYEIMHLGEEFLEGNVVETTSLVMLRIFISYTQTFSILSEISVKWPTAYKQIIKGIEKVAAVTTGLISSDCVYASIRDSLGIEIVFQKAFVVAFTPLFFIIAFLIFWIIYFKLKKRPIIGNEKFVQNMIVTIILVCFDMQPEVIESGFSLLKCTNLYRKDHPIAFLVEAYDVKCWEGSHLHWISGLAFPSLVLWIVLLPGAMFFILWRKRSNLRDHHIAKKYSFIYMGYKQNKFYWEFVIMIRKIAFVANAVFGAAKSTNLEIYLSITCILLTAHILHAFNKPYNEDILNGIETKNLTSLSILVFCALYFQLQYDSPFFSIVVTIFGIVGNFYFLLFFFKFFIALQIRRIKQKKWIMKILKFIDKYFCFCIHLTPVQRTIELASTGIRRVSVMFQNHFSDGSRRQSVSQVNEDLPVRAVVKSFPLIKHLALQSLTKSEGEAPESEPSEMPPPSPASPLSINNTEELNSNRVFSTSNNLVPAVKSKFFKARDSNTLAIIVNDNADDQEALPLPMISPTLEDEPEAKSPVNTIFWKTKADIEESKNEHSPSSEPCTESKISTFTHLFISSTKKIIDDAASEKNVMKTIALRDIIIDDNASSPTDKSQARTNKNVDDDKNDQIEDILKCVPIEDGSYLPESLKVVPVNHKDRKESENSPESASKHQRRSTNSERTVSVPSECSKYEEHQKEMDAKDEDGNINGNNEEENVANSPLLEKLDDEQDLPKGSVKIGSPSIKSLKGGSTLDNLKKNIKRFTGSENM